MTEQTASKVPQIRFKGFGEEWEPESVCNHSWPSGTGISAKFFNIQF
jgi:hypothetical protein